MSISVIVLGLLETLLYCAIIILVAFVIVWVATNFFHVTIDAKVYYWGRIVVGLLCLIAFLAWLFSLLGGGPTYGPHFLWRW